MAHLLTACLLDSHTRSRVARLMVAALAVSVVGSERVACAESQFSVAGGYSITGPADGPLPIGWFVSAAVKPADVRWLRVVSEVASEALDRTHRHSERAYLFMNGVRLTSNAGSSASVFGEVLVGVYHAQASTLSEADTNHLTAHAGGGVDFTLVEHVAARFQLVARRTGLEAQGGWSPVFMTAIVLGPARSPKR